MSQQLTISSAFSAFAMALLCLCAAANVPLGSAALQTSSLVQAEAFPGLTD